ncbi:hypothetical protein GJAV_G00155860 [Gymnothorax javanicus]|nr:hypothetical protein GJAV_G00155860 [Gymnothorax javanicus]
MVSTDYGVRAVPQERLATSVEVNCVHRDGAVTQREGGMEQGDRVEDEFACPQAVLGKLPGFRLLVARIFGVRLEVGAERGMEFFAGDGQIWLKMTGSRREVEEAKVFVKGLVNEAEQVRMSYPKVLQAVFHGAGGLFLHCMMKYTCAFIQPGAPGSLLISGLEEPAVRACSLIQDLLEKFERSQSGGAGAGAAGESLDCCKAFRSLVEQWGDGPSQELLDLPDSVKHALLGLVKEAGLEPAQKPHSALTVMEGGSEREGGGEREREREQEAERERRRKVEREREQEAVKERMKEMERVRAREQEAERERRKERERAREQEAERERRKEMERERAREQEAERERRREMERERAREQEAERERRREMERERAREQEAERERAREAERAGEREEEFLGRGKEMGEWQRDELGAFPEHSELPRGRERRRGRGAQTQTLPHPPAAFSSPHTSPPALRPAQGAAAVTGEQRFHEGLLTPFHLQLSQEPGDPTLRTIIIDGSNVAMSHGLGQFFSCRGIALAVQYFWNRGHRRVTTFVPRWRQKRDPRVKEQQYLSVLEKLGCLSFTPSREVQGKIINSYDDRFMLQLAQETEGVIVTNDNLRDLLDESPAFSKIIRNRLLQYTFVGDHFMVPDDPLGRAGPHLSEFLRSAPRYPAAVGQLQYHSQPAGAVEDQRKLQYRTQPAWAVEDQRKLQYHTQPAGAVEDQRKLQYRSQPAGADPAALRTQLLQAFPGQDSLVTLAIQCNPDNCDITSLSRIIQSLQRERAAET